jgi:hypothetical protein
MWLTARQSGWSEVSSHWFPWASLFAFIVIFLSSFAALALWRRGRLKKTVYALINRRAIKLQTNKPEPNSISLDLINRFVSKIQPDGSGDLAFGFQKEDMQGQGRVRNPCLTFEGINDVSKVLSLAQQALAKLGYQPVS